MRHALLLFLLIGTASGLGAGVTAQQPVKPASLREQAFGAENRGDYATAADAFLELVEAEPHVPQWVVSAGSCLGRSGRFTDAIDLLDKAVAKFPGAIEVQAMLARTFLLKSEVDAGAFDRAGLRQQAVELAEAVLELNPDHEDSRLVLAQARYMLGDWDEAVKQAEEATRRHKERPGAHILLGRIATDRFRDLLRVHAQGGLDGQALADLTAALDKERKLAQSSFEQAARLDPTRAHPHVMLARIALFDQRDADVRRHLLDALGIDPDVRVDHERITKGLDWQQRREVYADVGRRYSARADAQASKRGTLIWYEGRALFDGAQWPAARQAFEQALTANPEAINSHYYAALSAYELGDHDGAEKHAAKYAAASAPGFAGVVLELGGDRRGQVAAIIKWLADRAYSGGRIAASRDLNHVIALLWDTADAWNNRAFLCRETGQFEQALSAYQRALEKEPNSPQLLNDTAVVLHYHLPTPTNLKRARTLYAQAIENSKRVLADSAASAALKTQAQQSLEDATKNLAAMK